VVFEGRADETKSDDVVGRPASPEYQSIHLPEPSFWPIVLTMGIMAAAAGLMLHPLVVAIGAVVTLVSIIGWGVEGGQP
jgi:hypothetical protein